MENDVRNIPQKLYVLGHPVAHSKSPVMYNAVYAKLGFPWEYDLMDCETPAEAKAFLAARDFLSVNITTPYKPEALAAATARAASAKLAHGANILVKKGDALIAFNTDGRGCVGYLERTGFSFDGAKVAVCGTGPTALAILHATAIAGASEVLLLSRDKERAREVLDRYVDEFGTLAHATVDLQAGVEAAEQIRRLDEGCVIIFLTAYDETTFKFGSYTTSTQAIAAADLVINATPLGMREGDPAPFDVSLFHEGQRAFDVVYAHGETAFAAGAKAAGCTFADGGGMLVAQAVATVQAVCDVSGIDCELSFDELFEIMANAAGFNV